MVRLTVGRKHSLLFMASTLNLGLNHPHIHWAPDADHSHPSISEVKNEWICTSTPFYVFISHNFLFTLKMYFHFIFRDVFKCQSTAFNLYLGSTMTDLKMRYIIYDLSRIIILFCKTFGVYLRLLCVLGVTIQNNIKVNF